MSVRALDGWRTVIVMLGLSLWCLLAGFNSRKESQ